MKKGPTLEIDGAARGRFKRNAAEWKVTRDLFVADFHHDEVRESNAGWQPCRPHLTLARRHSSDTFAARASLKRMSARGGRSARDCAYCWRVGSGTPEALERRFGL